MASNQARSIRIRGVVQGVGFRPHIYRLANNNELSGWVLNEQDGVEIHLEGATGALDSFLRSLTSEPPPAADVQAIDVEAVEPTGCHDFTIRQSRANDCPTVSISADLSICVDCLEELFDSADRRFQYPYINCTNCGPRYTVIEALPYDRANTTMHPWPLDEFCASQYHDPTNRRFHAQPVACPYCGPHYFLRTAQGESKEKQGDADAVLGAVRLLNRGKIIAVKGLGGYHLACDATNPEAVFALRERKFRKEKPFGLMGRNLEVLKRYVKLSPAAVDLISSPASPIVLLPARCELSGIAPDNQELGVMLPYTPLHHMLFGAGAPELLVMTSANRSSEPIAYKDEQALIGLEGLADAFLIGERPIARRVDDSVARISPFGPVILRRARGFAPAAVSRLDTKRPILALGADLKNTVTLVVEGQAFVSQHIGDLVHHEAFQAFRETIDDLVSMYQVKLADLLVVSDTHPQYFSTTYAPALAGTEHRTIQHHRAHIASVLAEKEAWSDRIIGVAFDGTGYGDDGTIWGGEVFLGSLQEGLNRVAHLRPALLAGGDAAVRHPVQAAAGFLHQLEEQPDFSRAPFDFPKRYRRALQLIERQVRTFPTTSVGRLFDTVAALLGFTRKITFEGQAAMWLQHQSVKSDEAYPFPFSGGELDFRPLLEAVIKDRLRGRSPGEIGGAFHAGIARGLSRTLAALRSAFGVRTVVLSGGVFQNGLLFEHLHLLLKGEGLRVWTNHLVPPNDGGISLGQAALAAFGQFDDPAPQQPDRVFDSPAPARFGRTAEVES